MLKEFIILFFIGSWAVSLAQEPICFTTKQGLPTNHVYDLAQDKDGFMWFATKQGLVKYDGETFKTFTTQNGLSNNDTWELRTDFKGKLYYFSKSAYQGYIESDSIYKFSTKNKEVLFPDVSYKNKNDFWFYANGIKSFKNNEIIDLGLDVYKWQKFTFELLKKYNLKKEQLILLINPEKREVVFINSLKKEIYLYDWNFNLKKTLSLNVTELTTSSNFRGFGLIYNQLGYYAFNNGILFIDFNDYSTRYLSFEEIFNDKVTPRYFRLKSLPNEIQIAIPGHLAILDYNLKIKETYTFSKELGNYSYKDTNGNIWITSITNGISLLPNTQLQNQYNFKKLKVQKINLLDNIFYVGINNRGIYTLDLKTNQEKKVVQFNVPHTEIYQIKKDKISKNDRIVIAICTYEVKNNILNKIKPNNTRYDLLENETTAGGKDYFTFKNNDYIISSTGIIKCGFNDDFSEIVLTKQGLISAEVYKNNAYICGSDGLFQFKEEKLIPVKNDLSNIPINTLFSNDNFLFVGTDGRGLYLYDEKNSYHLKSTDGLSIQRIIIKDNFVWLATQKGVFKVQFNKDNLEQSQIVDAYFTSDGLLQNNTNDIYLDDQFLYAASDTGLAKLNLNNSIYKKKPKLYFKTKRDTLTIDKKSREHISVSFASLDFVNQEHLQYQYRLLPQQKDWVSTDTKTINFSNLSPDIYTLEVKAIDQHNNESVKKLLINVAPLWWETTWAKFLFGVLLFLLFIMLIKIMKKQIQKKEEAKAQQQKRIVGLELQALRSQMNPHFVHNSLNAIQYYIQRNEVELSENYLSKFSQLIRLFFEYSRRQSITIQEEINLLKYYLEIEKMRFEEKLNYTISVSDEIDQEEQSIPSMILQPIVENAVNHGIFHKNENGEVKINFTYVDENSFQVVIIDDGIGINKSKSLFKTSSKNYQSNSSQVLQERLELLNQSSEWKISFIKDKSELDKSETGTIVTLLFKQKESS